MPDCPWLDVQNATNLWNLLSVRGSPAHNPCWNSLFCVAAADGDWLNAGESAPVVDCLNFHDKLSCEKQSCKWVSLTDNCSSSVNSTRPLRKTCIGGFYGWYDSWAKSAYARCCDAETGCLAAAENGNRAAFGCFDIDSKREFLALKALALSHPATVGLGPTYLEIAQSACTAAISELNMNFSNHVNVV